MTQPSIIQTSFHSGEWAPALNAQVDIAKYRGGAALLRNFFVDYRGGATTRPGTAYIARANSANTERLIPFQASFLVSYILEFFGGAIRFINNGKPVVEAGIAVTGTTTLNPLTLSVANTYVAGERVLISGIVGLVAPSGQPVINGVTYRITSRTAGTITLENLNGVPVNATGYSAYTSGGQSQRVYQIVSPYQAGDLVQLKFTQNVNVMVICHPNYPPYELKLITGSPPSWTMTPITFGSVVATPVISTITMAPATAASANYSYRVTAVDSFGRESGPSAPLALANAIDFRVSPFGSATITWAAVAGAAFFNVYRAPITISSVVPVTSQYGYVGSSTGVTFVDSNTIANFADVAPVVVNPFAGSGVQTITITAGGAQTNATPVALSFTGGGGSGAQAAITGWRTTAVAVAGGANAFGSFAVGGRLYFTNGLIAIITGVTVQGFITSVAMDTAGTSLAAVCPGSYIPYQFDTNGGANLFPWPGGSGGTMTFTITWTITSITVVTPGTGYATPPAVVFTPSFGAPAATTTLGAPPVGNPTVPSFFQQRLIFGGPVANPGGFNASQPGAYYNFNTFNPIQPDSAFAGTLVANQLNTVEALVAQPQGLIVLTDKQAWLVNGGSAGAPISATQIVANAQAYNGIAATVPPIIANDHLLYVQSKGSIVRDLAFNFGTQVYTGTDISIISSHLFYGYNILEWAWAEEPFKLLWAVRDDGQLLCLTFLKEQELIAWTHADTNGSFKSIATVVETDSAGNTADAVYVLVQRLENGQPMQYIERLTEMFYSGNAANACCVDAALLYSGVPVTQFSGALNLAGYTVTGLADGVVIPPFVMPANGAFVLPTAASKVSVGLAYIPQLQTLQLDLGEPTVQGRRKKISGVTVRVKEALGLEIGKTFDASSLTPMKDLVRGNVGSATNTVVTNLVTGDARTIIDPSWDVPGQYCIQQSLPFPASILGVMPEITVGDTKDERR